MFFESQMSPRIQAGPSFSGEKNFKTKKEINTRMKNAPIKIRKLENSSKVKNESKSDGFVYVTSSSDENS